MDAAANECLWLVHNGISFDVAFSLDDVKRRWMAIQFRQFHGDEFDLNTMTFKQREA